MAKQAGELFITGTIDGVTFYKMDGVYYVRLKSSLTRKRFMKDARFERSRKSAERFALGNRLASKLYGMVVEEKRVYKLFCFLKRRAILLLKEEKSIYEVEEILMDYLIEFGVMKKKIGKSKSTSDLDLPRIPAKFGPIKTATASRSFMTRNKMIKCNLLLWMLFSFLSCKRNDAPSPLYGVYREACVEEAVPDNARADTSLMNGVVGDSIVFTREEIGNCCGRNAAMVLKAVDDTLRLTPAKEVNDEEVPHCDCNCLFEKRLAFRKPVFDSIRLPILFEGVVINSNKKK